ncbi:MAG TPA: hypothetical protein VFZ66_19285 [Herpetosiphonaceae bacterium]
MSLPEVLFVFAAPYLLAWLTANAIRRVNMLPPTASPATIARNHLGRLTVQQRRALLLYNLPEIIFGLAAILFALGWQPDAGLQGTALRWGLAGMALVRLGLLWPVWRDLVGGKVSALSGPLRKIQFRSRLALATEDGPIVVLPVERALYAGYDAGQPVTIFYTPHSKRVVAVQPLAEDSARAASPVHATA